MLRNAVQWLAAHGEYVDTSCAPSHYAGDLVVETKGGDVRAM